MIKTSNIDFSENNPKKYTFSVMSYKKTPSPFLDERGLASYSIICDVRQLPLDIPTKTTNPREQKLTHKVARDIKKSFLENKNFWLLNRGILFSVESLFFDKNNNKVALTLNNMSSHGNVDGGHTYEVIKENLDELMSENNPLKTQYVRLEIVTGVESFFDELSEARNTSNQVELTSIAELQKKFNVVKHSIEAEPYKNRIAYKQFSEANSDKKLIDVREMVSFIMLFNPETTINPVQAYSSKQACLNRYLEIVKNNDDENSITLMDNLIPEVFKLYDFLEENLPNAYKKASTTNRYGSLKGVKTTPTLTKFYQKEIEYYTPNGLIYPIFGAFTALVGMKKGKYNWLYDPYECFEAIGSKLITETVERSRTLGNNPQSVGKDSGHWNSLHQTVQNYSKDKEIEYLRSKII